MFIIITGVIPEFPGSVPITLDVIAAFNHLASCYPPYSDFNFVSLMSWNKDGQGRVSALFGNLVIWFPHYTHDGYVVSFMGSNKIVATAQVLLGFAEQELSVNRLELVPELVARVLQRHEKWRVREDPNNHDYILSLPLLMKREGSSLRRFRRAATTFERRYGSAAHVRPLAITERAVQAALIDVFMKREYDKRAGDFTNELSAFRQLLTYAGHYRLVGYGLEVHGNMKAFIICEDVGQGWCIGHFWKADTTYNGIYSYLMLETARQLAAQGIVWMNIEQDLGIDTLRFFKQSFGPANHLKKFIVQRARVRPVPVVRRETAGSRRVATDRRRVPSAVGRVQ